MHTTTSGRRPASPLLALLALAGALLGPGCGSSEPDPGVDPDAHIPLATRERVLDSLSHLNNESATERWRDGLVEAARESADARGYVLRKCKAALQESYAKGGSGAGVLRPDGRRRAFEVAGRVGDGEDARAVLRLGLEDALDIRVAALAGLAAYGDATTIAGLAAAAREAPAGSAPQTAALQALRGLATPERRAAFLDAQQAAGRELLRPIVLATFPVAARDRGAALREVAQGHGNPFARAFALEVLVEDRDPAVRELARRALDDGHPSLRPVALGALGASGGDEAALELARVLEQDPKDAVDVARGLYLVGTTKALAEAVRLVGDARRRPATRAALCREVLARVREGGAPADYRAAAGRQQAREALRGALADGAPVVVVAAADALGSAGERGPDVEALLELLREPNPEVAPAVVRALGRLGGEYAAAKLVELVAADAALRDAAADALGGFAEPRDIQVDAVIDLLEAPELGVRKAAIRALAKLSGSDDRLGFDPDGTTAARAHAVQRWRDWWSARRN